MDKQKRIAILEKLQEKTAQEVEAPKNNDYGHQVFEELLNDLTIAGFEDLE